MFREKFYFSELKQLLNSPESHWRGPGMHFWWFCYSLNIHQKSSIFHGFSRKIHQKTKISEWFSKCCKIIGNVSQNLPNGFLERLGLVWAQKKWLKIFFYILIFFDHFCAVNIWIFDFWWFFAKYEANLHYLF